MQYRWWNTQELRTSTERFYPRGLPQHIDTLIAGLSVEEPLELWDPMD